MSSPYPVDMLLAVIVALGGLMGYVRKKSTASLASGLTFGLAYAGAAYSLDQGDTYTGHGIGLGASALLAAFMAGRYVRTGKFMPAGAMTIVGALGVFLHADNFYTIIRERAAA
mmetsp:Transcript_23935/g.60972  ORF Transcript_23935/g.60972 Transcript_23935/m.60972 type:complete len:114 (-) Transcript_23935:342-683(-)